MISERERERGIENNLSFDRIKRERETFKYKKAECQKRQTLDYQTVLEPFNCLIEALIKFNKKY